MDRFPIDLCSIPKMGLDDFVFQNGEDQAQSTFGFSDIMSSMCISHWDKKSERAIGNGYSIALEPDLHHSLSCILLIYNNEIVGIYTSNLLEIRIDHRYGQSKTPCAEHMILEAYRWRGIPDSRRNLSKAGRKAFERAFKLASEKCNE